ncbi:hypothetical protein FHR95_002626 [Halomonas fontilapidosi]|uniref:Alkylhydroperoxidase n=1 Tax=Halomonas fontilapidosi TaxID=616675 RepID=A0A7W5H095_9GAMM|nr:hypothetical protein [Halomonas fontilapidosi]
MTAPISRFPVPESIHQLPDDVRDAMLAVQEKAGFVPNVFLMLATARPSSVPSSPTTMP